MAVTANRQWTLPTVAGDSGVWGDVLNDTTFASIDKNLGGIVSKSLSSSNVALSASESLELVVRLSGTLSASVQVTTSCVGFHIVENLCTLGAYAVTMKQASAATTVTIPYGRHLVVFDGTNGARIAATTSPEFPSGTRIVFQQTTAPTGWTKDTTHNNKALRIVSGTVSSGGSTAFTSVFTSRTISVANMPAHAHSVSDPGHYHSYTVDQDTVHPTGTGRWEGGNGISGNTGTSTTGITITNTGSGTAMDFAVQYVDVTVAQKD